nr:LysR family transcriptional regulator [uncultured Blautia sp.]
MTLRHLNIFVAVADYGSMSAAAAHLYLSQPTVSQAIRELEKHYNGLLFERLGKKLYLTERGKLLLPRARELVHQFEETEELMLNQGQSSTLKLGSTITVGTCLTPFLIPELQKSCPEVKVSSYVSNTREIEQKLLRSELDVGIVEGEILSSDLIVLPIVEDCLVLAVGKEHPLYERKILKVQDLNDQQFAMREQGSGTRQLFEDYAERHQISFQTVWEANSPRTLLNAVLYDRVLSVMSLRLMYHEVQHESIHVFRNENGEWNRKFKLVYHKNKFLTPAIHELERILHSYQNVEIPKNAGILR